MFNNINFVLPIIGMFLVLSYVINKINFLSTKIETHTRIEDYITENYADINNKLTYNEKVSIYRRDNVNKQI